MLIKSVKSCRLKNIWLKQSLVIQHYLSFILKRFLKMGTAVWVQFSKSMEMTWGTQDAALKTHQHGHFNTSPTDHPQNCVGRRRGSENSLRSCSSSEDSLYSWDLEILMNFYMVWYLPCSEMIATIMFDNRTDLRPPWWDSIVPNGLGLVGVSQIACGFFWQVGCACQCVHAEQQFFHLVFKLCKSALLQNEHLLHPSRSV